MNKKNLSSLIGSLIFLLVVLGIGGWMLAQKSPVETATPVVKETKDELTGSWRAEGAYKEGNNWFVVYTFKNGEYTMKTDSSQSDHGSYSIIKNYGGTSLHITKTSAVQKNTYDQYITLASDGTYILIDGAKFLKQK